MSSAKLAIQLAREYGEPVTERLWELIEEALDELERLQGWKGPAKSGLAPG